MYHSEKIDTGISIIKNLTPPNHKILFIDHLHRINFNRNQLDIASSDKKKIKLCNENITISDFTAVYILIRKEIYGTYTYIHVLCEEN